MSNVTVNFLGTGDAFGSGGRLQTCIFIDLIKTGVMLDFGASSLIAMKQGGIDSSRIDTIILSHLHGDHFGGLPFLFLHEQFISKRSKPIRIAGPPGHRKRITDAMETLFPGSSKIRHGFAVDFAELAQGTTTSIESLRVTPFPVPHASGSPSYALRVECGGQVISYSGDTEWTETLLEAAAGADLFICEAYFWEKKTKYHMDYRTLMEHRERLNCRRIILTHMSEDVLARLGEIEVEYARDGQRIFL